MREKGEPMLVMERLAEFVSQLRPADLPRSSREMAARCVLDLLGAAVAGYPTVGAAAAREFARALFAEGPASVWFASDRRPPEAAALANSGAAAAIDADDGHAGAGGHPGASIIPAAFAAAEETGASGQEVLAAIVIGYEVAIRVAASRDFAMVDSVSTGRWCAYGAAAAGGWLWRLSPDALVQALAIAGLHAPGLPPAGKIARAGDTVKEGIPWSTLTGLAALALAERGLTGRPGLLDCPRYFDTARILEGLGQTYAIEQVYFKPYACCRWIHPTLDAFLALKAEHALRPEEVTKVRVSTFGMALTLSNYLDPGSLEAAQFSVPFCLAVAAYEGREALLPLSTGLLGRRELIAFARRVELQIDPALDAMYPAQSPARVVVEAGGRRLEKRVDVPLGAPANSMELSQLTAKFRRLTDGHWSPRRQDEVIAAVLALDGGRFSRLADILAEPFHPG